MPKKPDFNGIFLKFLYVHNSFQQVGKYSRIFEYVHWMTIFKFTLVLDIESICVCRMAKTEKIGFTIYATQGFVEHGARTLNPVDFL
jgi:hypothetical protein